MSEEAVAMMALQDVRRVLKARAERLSVHRLAWDAIRTTQDGDVFVEGQRLRMSAGARGALARLAGIPRAVLAVVPADLHKDIINRAMLEAGRDRALVGLVVQDRQSVVGVFDARLAVVPGLDVLDAVLAATPLCLLRPEVRLRVHRFGADECVRITLVTAYYQAECRSGDRVLAGIDILHADHGEFGTQVSSFLLRLSCQNGLLAPVYEKRKRLRIRRHACPKDVVARVQLVAGKVWSGLDAHLHRLSCLGGLRVQEPAAAIDDVSRIHGLPLSTVTKAQLLDALGSDPLGNGDTWFDVVNALTSVATHAPKRSESWLRHLMFLAGEVLRERAEAAGAARPRWSRALA